MGSLPCRRMGLGVKVVGIHLSFHMHTESPLPMHFISPNSSTNCPSMMAVHVANAEEGCMGLHNIIASEVFSFQDMNTNRVGVGYGSPSMFSQKSKTKFLQLPKPDLAFYL